jgi:hypothetical protein
VWRIGPCVRAPDGIPSARFAREDRTVPDSPADTRPEARPDAKCPHCDHVFVVAEITDEWCESCGKKIPEMLLKDIRPKPHLRHPHPLPEPTKVDRAEEAHETKVRVTGLVVILAAILLGLVALVWGGFNQASGNGIGAAWWVGGAAGVAFVVGLVMLNSGHTQEE